MIGKLIAVCRNPPAAGDMVAAPGDLCFYRTLLCVLL